MADPPQYRAIQINGSIDRLNDWTQAFGINNKGEVTGVVWSQNDTTGLLWLPDEAYNLRIGSHSLIAENASFYGSFGFSINDNGRVAGWRRGQFNTADRLNIWNLPAYSGTGAIIGEEIETIDIARTAINNDDIAVATRWGPAGFYQGIRIEWSETGVPGNHPLQILPPPGSGASYGITISDSGWSAGVANPTDCADVPVDFVCHECNFVCQGSLGFTPPPWFYDSAVWTNGVWSPAPQLTNMVAQLGEYTVFCPLAPGWVLGMNSANRMAGGVWDPAYEFQPEQCVHIAAFWASPVASPLVLPWPTGMQDERTTAFAISEVLEDDHVYVGGTNEEQERALLWRVAADKVDLQDQADWQAFDLNDLTDLRDTDFYRLVEATGINEMGWICGWGRINEQAPQPRAFVLIPVSGPKACLGDLNGDGMVGVGDLLILLGNWGPCPPNQPCWADLNGDGSVGVADLLILLANWGNCPRYAGSRYVPSRQEITSAVGITEQQWDDFIDVLTNGSERESENWRCWLERHITQCSTCRPCPDRDPFE